MQKKIKLLCWRSCLICVETVAVVAVLLAIALGILVGTLRAGPVSINFAKDYIQANLHNPERGIYAEFGNAALSWPEFDGPFMLGLDNGRVYRKRDNADDIEIISIEHVDLGLSKASLMTGRIRPVSLIMTAPSLDIVRNLSGEFDVGFGELEVASAEVTDPAQISEEQTDFLERILNYIGTEDDSDEASPLSHLKLFHLKDAQIRFTDREADVSVDFARSSVMFESEKAGLKARADLYLHDPEKEENERSSLIIEGMAPRQVKEMSLTVQALNFDLSMLLPYLSDDPEVANILKKQDVVLDAKVKTVLDSAFLPEEVEYVLMSSQGALNIDYLSDKALRYSDLMLGGTFHHDKGYFKLTKGSVTAGDVTFDLKAQIERQEDGRFIGPVRLSVAELPQDKVSPLWPQGLDEEVAREWLSDKMSGGVFRDVVASLSLSAEKGENGLAIDADDIKVSMVIDAMDVDYRHPLPPLTKATAQAEFLVDEERLSIKVEKGTIGGLDVKSAELEFNTILQSGKGVADITVDLEGQLANVFRYIEKEPIAVSHKFDVAKIEGDAVLKVGISMPTVKDLKMEQVSVNVDGTVSDALLPNVLEGLSLAGGPFTVAVNNEAARVSGKGELSGRPTDVSWMEYLSSKGKKYKSQIKAKLRADKKLRDQMGIDLSDFIAGAVGVDATYTEYRGGKSVADAVVDLTPAIVSLEPFDYQKAARRKGSARFKAVLQNGKLQEIEGLRVRAPDFSLNEGRLIFKSVRGEQEISKARLPQIKVGNTDTSIDYEMTDVGTRKIWLKGKFLDLRPFLKGDEEKKPDDVRNEPPLILSVSADQMQTDDAETVSNGKIYADIDAQGRFNQLEMDAVAGAGDIYLRFKPNATGVRTFRLEADDAGAALKAFGLYDNIRGGRMVIYGEPIRGIYDRNLVGLAEITDFRVVKAPGLARLLGAMSLPGVSQLLNNEGIVFTKLESSFDWLYRPQGSVLVLKEGRTSGNSLGLTFDGTYDQGQKKVDLSGTIIPLSTLNKALGAIPVLGDILGGAGGMFAATYTIKGEGEDPEIKVNPLSVLAPGILRRILFE